MTRTIPILVGGLACLLVSAALLTAGGGQLPSTAEVKQLQAKFRGERERLATPWDKMFLADLLTRAEYLAKRGDDALANGRLLQASVAFRQARWQLPYLPTDFPSKVSRVFGNLRLRHTNEVTCAAFSPDGKLLATGGRDRLVRVWDMANGSQLLAYAKHGDYVRTLAFTPDGKFIASGGGERDVRCGIRRPDKTNALSPARANT